ncbi:hypothetical protein GUJ93_ZPchr0010g7456 [Zizania palustris]|uniref:Pentatricopeptide repeat-containing protein n=1 Tax=Zizania palustris TaxID=103762 RepID=A0A8J6BC36_ZIZPA|nr:hypothetical protein GUJ93_ZPchr0010g7456 [Zizania palustris]
MTPYVSLFDFFSSATPNIVPTPQRRLLQHSYRRPLRVRGLPRRLRAPFSPSAVTYRHLTKGLVAAGRIQDLLREMLNRGQGADSLVYNNLTPGYIDQDKWDKAFELLKSSRGERCMVYDGVVHTSFMEGYWKKGMDKFTRRPWRTTIPY